MLIKWEKPNLNQQVHNVNPTLTLWALHSFKQFVLAQMCNQCLSLNHNYVCFA